MAPYLLLLAGQISQASSVIMIKASHLHPALLASGRMALAAILVFPFWLIEKSRATRALGDNLQAEAPVGMLARDGTTDNAVIGVWQKLRSVLLTYVLPGLFLGLHFITWNIGARLTDAAHATLIVNLVPLVMPVLVFFMLKEKPKRNHVIGTAVALIGLGILAAADLRFDGGGIEGDIVCFVSMLFLSVYLAFGRRNKHTGLWSYVFPLYIVGALSSFAFSLVMVDPFSQDWSLPELLPLVLLAVFPTMFGHTVSNWAMRRFHPQLVSIVTVTQFVWAAIIAWLFFGEIPPLLFYPASLVVLAGCAIAIVPGLPKRKSRDIKPEVAELRD